ncbi:MAG: hypothetical protein HC831_06525 [Chloroflexia bacterium]|nr:hypothetical protein [Chloroflexia bacterium]
MQFSRPKKAPCSAFPSGVGSSFQGFQLFQLKEKITVIFFQKKTEKRKLYFKWKDAKKQGRRRNGAVYIPLIFCRPGTYLCFFFYWFLFLVLIFCQLLINGSGARGESRKNSLEQASASGCKKRRNGAVCGHSGNEVRAVCEWSKGGAKRSPDDRKAFCSYCLQQGFGGFFVFSRDPCAGTKKMTKPQPAATSRRA